MNDGGGRTAMCEDGCDDGAGRGEGGGGGGRGVVPAGRGVVRLRSYLISTIGRKQRGRGD